MQRFHFQILATDLLVRILLGCFLSGRVMVYATIMKTIELKNCPNLYFNKKIINIYLNIIKIVHFCHVSPGTSNPFTSSNGMVHNNSWGIHNGERNILDNDSRNLLENNVFFVLTPKLEL